jgi:chemotaxis family two-component system response regulator Rcp1
VESREDKIVEILLVEDSPADVRWMQESLASATVRHKLIVARDGEQALEILGAMRGTSGGGGPDLVLLDLNLPKKSGIEILTHIKTSSLLRKLPVIIYSSSVANKEVNLAYSCGANAFLQKPQKLDDVYAIGRAIESFWLKLNLLPSDAR